MGRKRANPAQYNPCAAWDVYRDAGDRVDRMIDYTDAEKALDYLKATDKEAARLKARWGWLDEKKKTIEAQCFMDAEGAQGAREKAARVDQRYKDHLRELQDAHEEWLVIYNQRKSAELQIEMWRSVNSNQRKGNI